MYAHTRGRTPGGLEARRACAAPQPLKPLEPFSQPNAPVCISQTPRATKAAQGPRTGICGPTRTAPGGDRERLSHFARPGESDPARPIGKPVKCHHYEDQDGGSAPSGQVWPPGAR